MTENIEAGVGATMGLLMRGFGERNADVLADVYADDADWVNAFGTVLKGRDQIVEYLRGLFADDSFGAGRPAGPPTVGVRQVGGDTVVVSVRMQILGQRLVDGGEIPVRDNHSLHVLHRGDDERWLVVSEMYMDAREDATYAEQ